MNILTGLHPLAIFPQLLSFGLFAPFLLRLIVGCFLLNLGWKNWNKPYLWPSALYIIFGLLLVVGLYTQVAAIVSVVLLKLDLYLNFYSKGKAFPAPKEHLFLYGVLVIILLSLIVTGPGFLAFDLPL